MPGNDGARTVFEPRLMTFDQSSSLEGCCSTIELHPHLSEITYVSEFTLFSILFLFSRLLKVRSRMAVRTDHIALFNLSPGALDRAEPRQGRDCPFLLELRPMVEVHDVIRKVQMAVGAGLRFSISY
ncbi:MAG: hypothetical protein JWO28_1910, partial [Hyphomicrobiales bacterium]|nr:hypothetical protein [Hyphomicrobiales bacterium]